MMKECGKNIALKREGTSQTERLTPALMPGYVQLNELGLTEWMRFAHDLGKHVHFFDKKDSKIPAGTWESFFKDESEINAFLELVEKGGDVPPHLALFVAFVRLLEFPKSQLNGLTKEHLDFYFQRILQIEKLPPSPDRAYLILELAKNVLEENFPAGTAFDGGKDALGKTRTYVTTEDFTANKSKITQLKNVLKGSAGITASEVANSYDGSGADFPDDQVQWWPFGHSSDSDSIPQLPEARIGFSIASHVLRMKEGEREVDIELKFSTAPDINSEDLKEITQLWFTGEDKWLGPFAPESVEKNGKKLTVKCLIGIEDAAVSGFDPVVHEADYATHHPVCRVMLSTSSGAGMKIYENLSNTVLNTVAVSVHVAGITSLILENDQGALPSDKPFYPFGTRPTAKSNFYIACPELNGKDCSRLSVRFNWLNAPSGGDSAFKNLYYAYRTDFLPDNNALTDINFLSSAVFMGIYYLMDQDDTAPGGYVYRPPADPANLIVKNNGHFSAKIDVKEYNQWNLKDNTQLLFEKKDDGFEFEWGIDNPVMDADNSKIRISLNQPFYHELYARIYALSLVNDDPDAPIPNEPYTPFADEITLDYSATASVDFSLSEEDGTRAKVILFHEYPFGQAEEDVDLKQQLDFLKDKNTYLLPHFEDGGELYIGLQNAQPQQIVSLLVKLAEGTENPTSDLASVTWSALVQNEWMKLDSGLLITDETDNFLKTGLVKFLLPKGVNANNTRLPSGLTWIRAQLSGNCDAVCQCIAIEAQAVQVIFEDKHHEYAHLKDGIPPDTISGMLLRKSSIKDILQPYASFGGVPEEQDDSYYLRVSERLRHKNRAVTLWDYEHLILQHFPNICKVRCLNHTSDKSFLAPGNVCLLVVPDIAHFDVFDIYRPMVSHGVLDEIKDFLSDLKSPLVKIWIENPIYEEVKAQLKVQFKKGYDPNYFSKKLKEAITEYISPWTHKKTTGIEFGKTLHQSVFIHYLERLEYVDYLEDVKLWKGGTAMQNVSPENPKGILCSVKSDAHIVSIVNKKCNKQEENSLCS